MVEAVVAAPALEGVPTIVDDVVVVVVPLPTGTNLLKVESHVMPRLGTVLSGIVGVADGANDGAAVPDVEAAAS